MSDDADDIKLTDRCERCGGPYELIYESPDGLVQYLCRECVAAKLGILLDGPQNWGDKFVWLGNKLGGARK